MDEQWTLSWSASQNALHVESMSDMLARNRDAFTRDRHSDYTVIAVGSESAMRHASEDLRCVLLQRVGKLAVPA
jgi:hypothetical protein